jgi:hypothetical protein
MILLNVLFALIVTLSLSLIFVGIFRNRGPWANLLIFFAILFLATWAGGLWILPFGPMLFGVHWLPFLLAGLIFALVLTAATPIRRPRSRSEAIEQARAEESAGTAMNTFLWVLLAALIVLVLLGYL